MRRPKCARLPVPGRSPRTRRGAVMVVAVWLLVILLIVGLGLAYDTQMAAQAAGHQDGQARAYYMALSGIERLSAELDEGGVFYTAPGQPWEMIDGNTEPISPEAVDFNYLVLAADLCGRIDLNQADETALGSIPDLTEEQIQAIIAFRGTDETTPEQSGTGTEAQASTPPAFRSLDDLLLVHGFTPDLLYGATSWPERLTPAERFRQEWALRQSGDPAATQSAGDTPRLSDWLAVGGKARRIASDGQARVTLSGTSQEDLQARLEAVAEVMGEGVSESNGGQQRNQGSPVETALRVLNSRNVSGWPQVWGAVNNNRSAVRLLADAVTLPETGAGAGAAGGGNGDGDPGGGVPGGGGGRGGGPGGGGPGGGGPRGGGPGTGGPRGRGGSGASAMPAFGLLQPAVYVPSRERARVLFAQGPGGGPGTGGGGGTGGGTGADPGGNAGGAGGTDMASTGPMEGPVNLNTAPVEVLMSLPQMTEEVAAAIVAYRDASPMVSRGDLLNVEEVTPAIFNAVIERVTVVSDTYLVRSLGMAQGVMPGNGRTRDIAVHLTAVLDRTSGRCRIVRLRQDN